MNINELTEREKKALLLIHHKLDYHNTAQLKDVCELLKEKKLFQTEAGQLYAHTVMESSHSGQLPTDCIYCGRELSKSETVICSVCERETVSSLRESEKKEPQAPAEQNKKPFKWKRLLLFLAVLFVILAVGFVIVNRIQKKPADGFTEQQFVQAYSENIATKNFLLGTKQELENNANIYPILPAEDYLLTFQEGDRLTGAALEMKGSDEDSRVRQLTLMSLIGVSIYPDMKLKEATRVVEAVIEANGKYSYEGYCWYLTVDGDKSRLMVLDEKLITAAETEAYFTIELSADDLNQFLMKPYDEVQKVLGDSVAVISENTRYFSESGVSLVYEEESGQVIYLDIDGSGSEAVQRTLCGVYYGQSQEEVLQILSKLGIQGSAKDDVWSGEYEWNGQLAELSVTFVNGQAALICSKIVNR